ncbi:MAG: prepilin-type N-terminal cleavage/methylation domain-containing protein [Clostridium sp.]|nr:prepilin-type N-terminal cleavage/methylation domain-containing protein [Clostridium sp.]
MKKISTIKKAFTLAEVLVTLLIIGVVASMTIPGLKKAADESSYVAGAQKAFASFSSATKMVKLKNGHVATWPLGDNQKILNLYKAQMNVMEMPNIASTKYTMKYLDGKSYTPSEIFKPTTSFYTADGMLWFLVSSYAGCNAGLDISKVTYKSCVNMMVDVNGPKKPNMIGIDIFFFYVTKDGVFPYGAGDSSDISTESCAKDAKSNAGGACAARILSEGKISW